jgi:hypothetical protein
LILFAILMLLLMATRLIPRALASRDDTPPSLVVWYGDHQVFGRSGLAQRWVNVLGNSGDAESGILNLHYRLNDSSPVELNMSPDQRRLQNPGDFNVEINPSDLHPGENTLVIESINGAGLETSRVVTVTYDRRSVSLPFTIDWAQVKNAQDVLQVVDGNWIWDASGIRPVEMGYDRMLAVGDSSWTNYEVTVPVTVHGIDPAAFKQKEGGEHAGVSIDLRWIGHSDNPRKCVQPRCGWNPVGDFNKYWFQPSGKDYLGLKVLENEKQFPTVPFKFEVGHTYLFKVSVQTTGEGNLYRMKVWEQGSAEPDWMFERVAPPGQGALTNPDHGAFSLVAHHSDVSFGNITVTPIQ